MKLPERWDSTTTDAAPISEAPPVVAAQAAVKLELDNDEIIEFSIKPSLWFIALVSARWVFLLTLLAAALMVVTSGNWGWQTTVALQLIACLATARAGVATLEWASRHYVLTNRRVMCFTGVWTTAVTACPLSRISRADLRATPYERILRLGTITIATAPDAPAMFWENVAHPAQVHEALLRAIHKSHG